MVEVLVTGGAGFIGSNFVPIKEQDPGFRSYYQAQYERRT